MERVSGVVESVAVKAGSSGWYQHGYKLPDGWYNISKKSSQAEYRKGDTIELEWELNDRGYKTVQRARKLSVAPVEQAIAQAKASPSIVVGDARQESIVRQNSLAHATSVVVATTKSKNADEVAKEVIRVAQEYFYQYSMLGKVPGVKTSSSPVADEVGVEPTPVDSNGDEW